MTSLPLVLAISGASGAIYGRDIFCRLNEAGRDIHLIVTATAKKILKAELGIEVDYFEKPGVTIYANDNFEVPVASGSFPTGGMIIAPCSMGCLGRISSGISSDLVGRAADVHLKEKRPLILIPRETPFSDIHLENMLRLNRAGATIMPASPAFTHDPQSMDDLAAFISARVFAHLNIPQDFIRPYKGA